MFMQGFGHPRSNAADIELVDKQNRLIFSTIVNGAFYNRLKKASLYFNYWLKRNRNNEFSSCNCQW